MIVSAHQPNFLPWLGYFDKMRASDLFILVDHVQFERQGYQNRAQIKAGAGARWLTVPVARGERSEPIRDKAVDNSRKGRLRWGRKLFLSLKYAYQAAPHFREHEAALAEVFDGSWERLLPLNCRLIELCRGWLGIRTPMVLSSELGVQGARSDMVLALCRAVGADTYLAGAGASREYLDLPAFARAGIRVLWQQFRHPRYPQLPSGSPFVERLSALDLLFNCGAGATPWKR
ncbi:MAG TPA: WbqC family protein [Elusimicrobiota bacterium]|jgi:hypothetical protein|nr:WbqC family protein [Elusimicrobiota bacterium]